MGRKVVAEATIEDGFPNKNAKDIQRGLLIGHVSPAALSSP
jgi:hypothetical protein